jgi:hypothetical protein
MLKEDLAAVDYDMIVNESVAESSAIQMNDDLFNMSEDDFLTCIISNKSFCFVTKSLDCNFDAAQADELDRNSVINLDKSSSQNDTT